jgi:hypothetical protein
LQIKHQRRHSKHRGGSPAKHQIGGEWWRRIPKGITTQISSERRVPRFPTGGAGRGGGGEYFAKVAAAIQSPESSGVSEEGE